MNPHSPRVAAVTDAATVARLLDAFNRGYRTPTRGAEVLTARLRRLLTSGNVIEVLAGDPAVGVALATLRPNVWYDGAGNVVAISGPRQRRA